MRQLLVLLLATALAAPDGLARSRADEAACAEVKQEIREIESKMRSGYTRAQGEKYEARLRKLKAKRRKLCR
jgi:hypothetical protein